MLDLTRFRRCTQHLRTVYYSLWLAWLGGAAALLAADTAPPAPQPPAPLVSAPPAPPASPKPLAAAITLPAPVRSPFAPAALASAAPAAPAGPGDPAPAPAPKPVPKPAPPPPLIPDNLPNGQSIVHFYLFDDVTITNLMLHQNHLYGYIKDAVVDYDLDDITGFESNARSEVQLKGGHLPMAARKSLMRQNLFYFLLDDESQMLTPGPKVDGLYPPDRFRLYPDVFDKYLAPWGSLYDQRPFYIQVDLGYIQIQNVVRTELINGHLLTGSDIGLWRAHFDGNFFYGRTDRLVTTNNAGGEIKIDRYLNSWLYGYVKSTLFHDTVNLITYRFTNGAGLGLGTFQQNDPFGGLIHGNKMDFEAGLDRIEERNKDGLQIGWFGRLAFTDKMNLRDGIDFDNHIEYLPGLVIKDRADRGQYFIHYHTELRLKLWANLALRMAYNFDYNSHPPDQTPKDIHQISANLSFSYGR